jgi:alcohol dehydrogenase class IV
MDVLTHAIEAYTSRVASPVSDLFAVEAIKLTAQNLRKVVQNGKDLEARKNMMLANTLAGVAITHADTCIVHVIGEVIGGMYNTGHGITMALLLPAVTEHNCVGNLEKYAHISHMMGENVEGLSLREAAMKAPGAIRNMLKDISLPQGLAAIGVKDDLTNVLPFVTAPGMTDSNPRQLGAKEFELIIKGSLSPAMSYWDLGGI